MHSFIKRFDDPRLMRKIWVVRILCAVLAAAAVALVAWTAASGELTVRSSPTGGRFVSDGVLRSISASDSPLVYALVTAWYLLISLAFIVGLYLALAKIVEKRHGRRSRFFQRRYPH